MVSGYYRAHISGHVVSGLTLKNMNISLATLLDQHAQYRPDHLAVIFEDQRLTYRQFNARVNKLANALLGRGIRKGDKIATILNNCLELLDIYWAVAKIGAVVVPLSPLLRGQGLTRLLLDSDTVLVFTEASFVEILDPLKADLPAITPDRYFLVDAEAAPGYTGYASLVTDAPETSPPGIRMERDDYYNIIYSSGTTGLPKGIVHTHFIRAMYCTLFASAYRMTPESVVLHTGAIIFNGSFLTLMPTFYLGATYILHRQFRPDRLIETVEREAVTHIKMVPSQIIAMLNAPNYDPRRLESLEMLGTVGAPLLMEHKQRLLDDLPGRFYELYGLTEGFVTILDKHDADRKPESVGTPPPFFEMRIVKENGEDAAPREVGEIVGRGPITMPGYYKRPDLTQNAIRDGWLYSGDLGYVDEDGFLYLVDRKKDMIISGGVNVYPRDIEEIIARHPAVQDVAVFGVPDERWGETPVAAVILAPGGSTDAETLRAWINDHIEARFQRVSHVLLLDEFPRSAAGKTLKRIISQQYLDEKKP
jgi:acyl-CoA synthetase (AMP-forming)/AMP-acid ligase II